MSLVLLGRPLIRLSISVPFIWLLEQSRYVNAVKNSTPFRLIIPLFCTSMLTIFLISDSVITPSAPYDWLNKYERKLASGKLVSLISIPDSLLEAKINANLFQPSVALYLSTVPDGTYSVAL